MFSLYIQNLLGSILVVLSALLYVISIHYFVCLLVFIVGIGLLFHAFNKEWYLVSNQIIEDYRDFLMSEASKSATHSFEESIENESQNQKIKYNKLG